MGEFYYLKAMQYLLQYDCYSEDDCNRLYQEFIEAYQKDFKENAMIWKPVKAVAAKNQRTL